MSKSLGNSPDPLELIDKYGADGVRMGMMLAAPAGNDIYLMMRYVNKDVTSITNMECIPLGERLGSCRYCTARICKTGH